MEFNSFWIPVKEEGGNIILNIYLRGVISLYQQLGNQEDGVVDLFIQNYYLNLSSNHPTYISEAFGVYDDKEDEEEEVIEEKMLKLQTILLSIYNKITDKDLKKEYYKQFINKKGKMVFRFKVHGGSTAGKITFSTGERETIKDEQYQSIGEEYFKSGREILEEEPKYEPISSNFEGSKPALLGYQFSTYDSMAPRDGVNPDILKKRVIFMDEKCYSKEVTKEWPDWLPPINPQLIRKLSDVEQLSAMENLPKITQSRLSNLQSPLQMQAFARDLHTAIKSGAASGLAVCNQSSDQNLCLWLEKRFRLSAEAAASLSYWDLMWLYIDEVTRTDLTTWQPGVTVKQIIEKLKNKDGKLQTYNIFYFKPGNLERWTTFTVLLALVMSPYLNHPMPKIVLEVFSKGVKLVKEKGVKLVRVVGSPSERCPIRDWLLDQRDLTWGEMVDHISTLAIEEDTRLGLSFRENRLEEASRQARQWVQSEDRKEAEREKEKEKKLESRRVQQIQKVKAIPEGYECPICKKKGDHYAVDIAGEVIICKSYDPGNADMKKIAEDTMRSRKEARQRNLKKGGFKGRPGK